MLQIVAVVEHLQILAQQDLVVVLQEVAQPIVGRIEQAHRIMRAREPLTPLEIKLLVSLDKDLERHEEALLPQQQETHNQQGVQIKETMEVLLLEAREQIQDQQRHQLIKATRMLEAVVAQQIGVIAQR